MERIASVSFTCAVGRITLGDQVFLVGDIPQLGNWDVRQGVPLLAEVQGSEEYKTVNPLTLQIDSKLEYKYIIVGTTGVRWESFQSNRKLVVSHDIMSVNDAFEVQNSRIYIGSEPNKLKQDSAPVETSLPWPDFKQDFNVEDPLIIVSMNLPWRVKRAPPGSPEKWRFKPFKSIWIPVLYDVVTARQLNFTWIGYPHIDLEDPAEQEEVADLLSRRHRCVPLFIPKETLELHRKFCISVLFPLFHNIIETSGDLTPVYSTEMWQSYRTINSLFAYKVKSILGAIDTNHMIWINDYQLLLCPGFISHHRPVSNIGLFLHIPFPSSQIFKVIRHREELLLSMICCDLIGFHLFDYARHFMTTCTRLLGVEYGWIKGGFLGLKFYGRNVLLKVGHLGIETSIIHETCLHSKFEQICGKIKDKYSGGRRYALGVDPLQRLSGISNKFIAFAAFATSRSHPKYTQLSLVQLLFPPRYSSAEDSDIYLSEIKELADRINEKAGREVIEIVCHNEMCREKRYAYMLHAFCLVNTSLRDGLCLFPLEFIAVKQIKPAQVILSEFAGVSRALSSPVRVNPYDVSS